MVLKGKACDECTINCVTIHQKQKDPSSTVTRFVGIMFGENYSEFLYLPPKFARTVKDLAGKETLLEDALGRKWDVKVSPVDGYLAFREGWPKFFQDHHLEKGDIVAFNYFKGGHFIVQVYGRSACEITDFRNHRRQQKKPSWKNFGNVSLDQSDHIVDVNLMDIPRLNAPITSRYINLNNQTQLTETNVSGHGTDIVAVQNLPGPVDTDDPSWMINRDADYYQEEERNFLYDLSSFEMGRNTSGADRIEKITPILGSLREQTGTHGEETPMAVMHTTPVDVHSGEVFTTKFHSKPSDNTNSNDEMSHEVSKFQNDESRDKIPGHRAFPSDTGSPSKLGSRNAEVEDAVMPKCLGFSLSSLALKDSYGKEAAAMREKPAELGVEAYQPVSHRTRGKQSKGCSTSQLDTGKVPLTGRKRVRMSAQAVRVELDSSHNKVPSGSAGAFTVEVKSQSYVELPVRIPGKRESLQRKVVNLRDPTGRLWPLLYHGKIFFKVFTDNWTRFCKANNIKPGVICSFQVEDCTSCSYSVNIVRKSGQFLDE